jgi:hypothetical protein
MSIKINQEASTPLDSLRQMLAGFAQSDDEFGRSLSRKLGEIRKNSLAVIADTLRRPGTSALRKAVLPMVVKHDWPEWSSLLFDVLSKEPELTVFDEGCAALGALGTKSSWKALQRLKTVRADRDRQIILDRELKELDARQPLSYYLGRVLEGEGNAKLATAGSRMVAVVCTQQDIPAIVEAYQKGDKLTKRLLLRILPCVPCTETENFLAYVLKQTAIDYLDGHHLLEILRRLHSMPRPSARQECQNLVIEQFKERAKDTVGELSSALGQQDVDASHLFDALEEQAYSLTSVFAVEALRLLVEGKLAKFSVILTERADETEKAIEDTAALLECAADALSRLAKEGGMKLEDAVSHFRAVFNMRVGGSVFLESYADLVTHQDTEILAEFLADPEYERRFVLIDAIGAKENEHFVDFLLKAVKDPIEDVGQKAVQHLGKLRKGQEIFLDYFKSGEPEKMRLAVWGFKEIRLSEAGDLLLDFIIKDSEGDSISHRNDLLVEVAHALSNLRIAKAIPVFLKLLHDGQPLVLQIALAEALAALQMTEASLGLLANARQLKHSEVLFIALEGILIPFNTFEFAFPLENYDDFNKLFERCCDSREGAGQQFRAMCSVEHLFVLDIGVYERLTERLSDYLSHLRAQENWDKEANDRLNGIIRELAKRCERLRQLNQKETEINNIMQRTAPKGQLRSDALYSLRTKLEDPDLIIKSEMAKALAAYVQEQLKAVGQEWRDIAQLCEIGGQSRQKELIEPIKAIHSRATGLGLKSAARNALLKLGMTEAEMNRRSDISSVLVLEPSAFFRKRLVEALKDNWMVRDAGSKEEAEKMLNLMSADLLVSEAVTPLGWYQSMWEKGKLQYVYLCTSSRDIASLGEPPWLIGVLNKPFPMEKLLEDIKG